MPDLSQVFENGQSSLVVRMNPSDPLHTISHVNITIIIPTYKRTPLLQRLLEDISSQTIQPQAVIVVDGDSASGEVPQMLTNTALPAAWRIVYQPSNHANAPFQRYLGWRVASEIGGDVLLYFDDDLRLRRRREHSRRL
jgi:glycosyltransferase involved in cell wall biosynthesis